MLCNVSKRRRVVSWSPPIAGVMKFNVDSVAIGKPGLSAIGGVLCNDKGVALCMFSKGVETRDSNKAEVLVILEALKIFYRSLCGSLIVESDSHNAISWISSYLSKL